jgi:hypothetical protein
LHDVSIFQTNVIAETEAVSSQEVNMDVSPPAVSFEFEMMMLNVLQAMAHFGFTRTERLGPVDIPFPLDRHRHRYGFEFGINHEFWSKRTRAQLRTGEVKIVFLLELMIRKFVAHSHTDSIGIAIRTNQVNAGDLSFLTAILAMGRDVERFSVCA